MLNHIRATEQNKAVGAELQGSTVHQKDSHAVVRCVLCVATGQSGRCEAVCVNVFSPFCLIIKELCMVRLNGNVNCSTFSSTQLCINLSVQV